MERTNTLSLEPSNIDLDPTEKRSTASICDVLALVTNEVVLSTTVSAPCKRTSDEFTTTAPETVAPNSSAVAANSCVDMRTVSEASMSTSVEEETSDVADKDARVAAVMANSGATTVADCAAVRLVVSAATTNDGDVSPTVPVDVTASLVSVVTSTVSAWTVTPAVTVVTTSSARTVRSCALMPMAASEVSVALLPAEKSKRSAACTSTDSCIENLAVVASIEYVSSTVTLVFSDCSSVTLDVMSRVSATLMVTSSLSIVAVVESMSREPKSISAVWL